MGRIGSIDRWGPLGAEDLMRTWIASVVALGLAAGCGGVQDRLMAGGPDGARGQVVNRAFLKPGEARTFEIEYAGKVTGIPAGTKRLRVWIPVPQDTTVQEIRGLSFSKEPRLGVEEKYGNRVAYWEIENPGASFEVSMKFSCTRLEIRTDLELLRSEGQDPDGSFSVFKRADRLVLVDAELKKLSDEIVKGRTGALEKGRAIYDYVVAKMAYDKNHPGWGLGSTEHACRVGKGNCTDFHALFNSLCRAQGIASGFEIGLYLPYERKSQEKLGGYHCWAFFRVPGKTWVPVDCSEASRFGDRREFFFGGHTSNRVTLSTGRDLVLVPPQEGEPLNYFLNPHAEADGKPVAAEKAWTCRDLD
jgi:transglutaminase-like putative cysteine protease